MNFSPKKIVDVGELNQLENEFSGLFSDIVKQDEALQELNDFFQKNSVINDVVYYQSFFRWYTILLWKVLRNKDLDIVSTVCFGRQVPTALMVGFDVWKELLWYLSFSSFDEESMTKVYREIRNNFLSSEALVGWWGKRNFRIKDLIAAITAVEQRGGSSMELAELYSKVTSALTPDAEIDKQFFYVDTSEVVDKLIGLINFFIGVEPEKIYAVVDLTLHPERYEPELPVGQTTSLISEKKEGKNNFQQIKTLIESRFPYDESGQFTNLEGVLAMLDTLADEQQDERIRDLYVFDEATGRFGWNGELVG